MEVIGKTNATELDLPLYKAARSVVSQNKLNAYFCLTSEVNVC